MRKDKHLWPLVAWGFPIFPALSFYWDRWDALLNPGTAAMFFGFLGLFYFLNALILSTRIRFLDRLYGQRRVLTFRTVMTAAALFLILIHREMKLSDGDLVPTGQILLGKIALIIFVTVVAIAVMFIATGSVPIFPFIIRVREKFRFKISRILHYLLPLAGSAALIHVMLAATTTVLGFQMIIPAVYVICTLWLYLRFKLIRPAQLRKDRYTVSEIRQPGRNIIEVRMTGSPLSFEAGQFAYWRIFSGAVGREEHAFTISTPPDDDEIGFIVETCDNYSSALGKLRVGETAVIDGPYGNFSLPVDESIPVLLIAADIGISPFLSMLQDMVNNHSMRPVTLIWAVKSREDMVYNGELLRLAKRLPSFRYKPVIEQFEEIQSDGTLADFETGQISKGLIRGLCPKLKEDRTLVYICGPVQMRVSLYRIFKSIGVPRRRLYQEKINLE